MRLNITQMPKKKYYEGLRKLADSDAPLRRAGFWGQPDQHSMDLLTARGFTLIDLDIPQTDTECPSFVPPTTCQIIQTILANALSLRDSLAFILATTGSDKCEQGRQAAIILEQMGFAVIDASNTNRLPLRPALISNAALPLAQRVSRIMELAYRPLTPEEILYYQAKQIQNPTVIFHGVPPADPGFLDLFPDNTRIEGWTKLVELGVPGRLDLEWRTAPNIPTVFYTQSFCHKELFAAYLARQAKGLHIEGHGAITSSTEAKLQAFIGLAGISDERSKRS